VSIGPVGFQLAFEDWRPLSLGRLLSHGSFLPNLERRISDRTLCRQKLGFIGRGDGIAALAVAALDVPE